MPKIVTPLSDTKIKAAVSKASQLDKEQNLTDGEGLLLRVRKDGKALWMFSYYHPHSGKRKKISFGTYPELSLSDAREKRREARSLVAKYIDPHEHKKEQQEAAKLAYDTTLLHVAEKWFAVKQATITPDYAEDVWRSLKLHIFPSLGKTPISKLTATSVIDVLKPLAAKGSLETVRRVCQRLNEIMIWAVNTGLTHTNQLAGIKHAFEAPKKQNMLTLKPEQLPDLMKALNRASIKLVTRFLIEWQLHTMVRPFEAAGARWDEIDWDNEVWVIPAERMKKKREHVVPLTPQTMSILEELQPISGHREFLFPADRNPKTHANSQTANAALKRMGFGGQLVSHGLRALASTTLNNHGFDADLIEAALAHSSKDQVRAAYNRADYLKRRRDVMIWWSANIVNTTTANY